MTEKKLQALRRAGIKINTVADFCQEGSEEAAMMRNYFIFGFAGATEKELTAGLSLFQQILDSD